MTCHAGEEINVSRLSANFPFKPRRKSPPTPRRSRLLLLLLILHPPSSTPLPKLINQESHFIISPFISKVKGEIAMRAGRGRVIHGLGRTKLGFPFVFLFCSLFFLAGFFGSMLLSRDISGDALARGVRLTKVVDGGGDGDLISMPHGETGESHPSPIHFQVISWKPRALYFPKFASAEQCQTIIQKAKSRLKPSTLALRKGETEENTKGVRTSSGTFISASEETTGTLSYVEQKIARVTMIPRDHGEAFNILRYEIGQKYASHYDAFSPSEYGPQKSQRVASFLLYLSDVDEGGETMFPYENGANMDIGYDYQECIGLKVKPRQGDGLLFYSLFTNGTIDPTSLHGSCPVIKGEKWVATKWIRDQKN